MYDPLKVCKLANNRLLQNEAQFQISLTLISVYLSETMKISFLIFTKGYVKTDKWCRIKCLFVYLPLRKSKILLQLLLVKVRENARRV